MTKQSISIYSVLDKSQEYIEDIISNKEKHYITFRIPKRNGRFRKIEAPDDALKELQTTINEKVFSIYKPHRIAHGFISNRSPKTNAEAHVGAKIIVEVDIKDFFPSIKKDRVIKVLEYLFVQKAGMFKSSAHKQEAIKVISELITHHDRLPQGAPTSPPFSNLSVLGMDKDLLKLEEPYGATVTRYADDITMSSEYNVQLPQVIPELRKIVTKYGFKLNNVKTRVIRQNRRMLVTGVVVNEKPNIRKDVRRSLRAKLHNYNRDHTPITQEEYQRIQGQIAWIKYLNPLHGDRLGEQLDRVQREEPTVVL